MPKDSLAAVPLAGFFDLNFDHSVNHRRGVDGSDQRGAKQKARDNLQAIRILKTCVAENRAPSPEEQQKIALFYGFGGLPYSFRRPNGQITSGWSDVVLELESLTTEDEMKSLRARTVDAQYTSDAVVSAIWDTIHQALPEVLPNPQDPLQVLEPSVGSGVFLSLAPDVPMEFLAVEMDPITATVAKALHPREKIYNAPFQKVQFSETVDVVVGNPPFGKGKLLDMARPDLTQVSPNTHGYFFAKSMDRLRPGGLAIMVVSRYLLDADMPEHRAFRVWLHNQAELVSAVRLPHTVFSKTAFTDVVCDVVALRKRDHPLNVIYEPPTRKMVEDWTKARKKEIKEQEERTARPEELIYPLPDHLPAWIRGKTVIAMGPNEKGDEGVEPVFGNPWYREHPGHVLGELSIGWGKGLYRAGAPIVLPLPEFEDIGASLARVLKSDVRPGMLEDLDRRPSRTTDPEYPVLSTEDMGRRTTPYSYFIVPETARKAALESWKQIEAKMPNPDGRIPAPVASRLFTTEDQPLIGMRLPDWIDYRTREKKTNWKLVTFASSKAANDIQRLTGMTDLRDTLLDLLDLQRTEERRQTPEMQSLRRKLRQDYDRFVKRYHHLRRPVNESLMRNDPSWAMLAGLEIEYTPEVSLTKSRNLGIPRSPEQVVLSEIFERRTQYPIQPVDHVDSAVDAMMVSLSESGTVDPARLQSLTGKTLTAIRQELKIGHEDALAFIAPDGHWEERSQWLSGNIDEKIRMLRAAQDQSGGLADGSLADGGLAASSPADGSPADGKAAHGGSDAWNREIAILEAHRPPRISILDRTIHIGAFWLPQDVVSDFVSHLGGIQPVIHKNLITGEWSVKCAGHPPEYSTDDMSLQDLLMALHNRRTIQVTYQDDKKKTVVDAEATSLAVEKGDHIKDAWRDWIYADTDRVRLLEDHYNDLMNTYRPRDYDGRHLNLPGSNSEIRLRPHQKNAVWRMTQSKSTLLDHVVGAGKTFAAIAGVMEKRRTGQSKKPLVTVPNHLVGQWTKDWLRLYPDARLLVADKEDMAGSNRQVFLAKAAFNDVDAVIVAHSSFDRIPIDAEFYEEYLNLEIDRAENFLRSKFSMEGLSVKRMEKKIQEIRTRVERLHSQANESRDQGCLNFSEIGFDLLVVDESHNYKNVPYNTNLQNVRGLGNPAGSIKAENMMIKVTQCRDGGSGVVFLTGTPISNTVAEMYLLQKYMAPEKLEEKGIHTFDAWVSLFAEVQEEFAFTLTGSFKNLRTLAAFDNLPELVGMYRDYADVINQKDIAQLLKEQRQHAIPMPKIKGGKAEIVVCPMTPAQRRIIGEEVGYREDTGEPEYAEGSILWRLDNLPTRPGPGEDNILVIINDLRKANLDARAFDPSYVPEEGEETGKLGVCAENVKRIYDEWNEDRGTQLVYLDFSTPGKRNRQEQNALEKQLAKIVAGESPDATDKEKQAAESALEKLLEKYTQDEIQEARAQRLGGENIPASFVAYEELRNRMMALGIPREEIAFIHDADTDEKKEELFDAVRAGKVRVMIGSTPKMGPGMNVQDRLVAVWQIDAPYRPTDVEQRIGRIIRQGNLLLKKYGKDFRVTVGYFVTENSSDAGLWQILETKKKFIDQVRYYDGKSNRVTDPDAQALDPAAIKAQASGHEVLMLEVPLRARVKRLQHLKNGYREEMNRAQARAQTAREKLVELQGYVMPRAPEVAAQIRALQETLKTGGSIIGDSPADILSIDKKEDPAFIPWGQGSHERLVTKKFLMDKFNKTMRELNGQSVSARERVGFIGGFVVELEQLFTSGAMTIRVYPPDAKHIHALHINSTKFDPEKNVNFFSRLENMLDASVLETSIRNQERECQSAIRLAEGSQVFGQEEELQALQQQHQLASRLLRLKVRKMDGLEERLSGVFLQGMKKSQQEVQETNPITGETITVSRLMHSKEQERDAHQQAKTFVQEMIDAFSRPPLTENALSVLEKLGVSAKRREVLRESLGLSANDAASLVEAESAENEDEEAEELVEEKTPPEAAVDETVLKSRIGIREQVDAENPWLSASAPFLPDLSAPGNGIQVSLFDDLFATETPVQATPSPTQNPPAAPSVLQTAVLQTAVLQTAVLQTAGSPPAGSPFAGAPSAGAPSAGSSSSDLLPVETVVVEAKENKPEAVMENMEKPPVPAPSDAGTLPSIAPRLEDALLDYITQSYDSVVYLAKKEPSEENLSRYGSWKEAVKSALRELTRADAAFAGYDTSTVDMASLVHHFYLRHHAAPEVPVAPTSALTSDAPAHPIQDAAVPVLRTIPPALREFLPQSQYMATEQGLRGEERQYFSDKMRELEQVIANMPQTYQTEGQGDNALVTLHYFRGNADWYIIEKDSDPDGEGQIQAFGLADLGMGEPELGYINIHELVQAGVEMDYHFEPRTLRELKLEKYPEMVRDDTPAPQIEPSLAPQASFSDLQARSRTVFYSNDHAPLKSGETVAQAMKNWNDAGIEAKETDDVRSQYLDLPTKTGSLRVLYTQKPEIFPSMGWSAVEYQEPVILAELPDHAVLVAEQSYLDAYRSTLNPAQNQIARAIDTLAAWMTPEQMTALRNVMGHDASVDLPYTMRHLETIAGTLRDFVQSGPGNLPVPTPKTAEILAGAGRGILTYRSPDSLHWWFITGLEESGHLYGLQMVRSRPDSRWEAQMGPVSRQDLLDASFLLELAPTEPFVVADRMREMAPYIGGVDAMPAEPPRMASTKAAHDPKVMEQIFFDAGIPASGHTLGDLLGTLRENGLNLIAPSDVIDQYFYMERGESVRMVYGDPIGKNTEPLTYHDPVTLAVGPDHLILVAERAELDAYLAQNPQRPEVPAFQASTLNIPERLQALATPEQQSEWRALAEDDESRELLQVQLNHLDMGLKNLPAVDAAERLRLDGRAGLVLRSEAQEVRWLITGMDANGQDAFGLRIADETATLGRVDLRIALMDAPILEMDHEDGPLRADLRDAIILIESVEYADDPRAMFWRGGPDTALHMSLPRADHIEDILDYERNELGNEDVQMVPDSLDYLKLPPVRSLQWLTVTEEEAREYGEPHPVILVDPVILARDSDGGVLVAERAMLEAAAMNSNAQPSTGAVEKATGAPLWIPASVARFMGDAQIEFLTSLLQGTDQNTTVMLSPDDIRTQLNRLDHWINMASATSIQDVQAKGLNAVGQMALRMRNGDLMFVSALSEDGTTGYVLTLQTMTHRTTLETLNLSTFNRDAWVVDLTHEPQPLLVTLADHGYSQEAVTIERMATNAIPASTPGRTEKAGLTELARKGPTYQSAIDVIENAGGWDAVADSPALQKSLQNQLDHLIQLRAEQVSQVLQEGGWKWSGAAFSRDDEDFKIFPNGRSSGGNMVHWGYRMTMRDGDTPVAIDVDDEMTMDAQGLVTSMLDQMQAPVARASVTPQKADQQKAGPSVPDVELSPEIQNHLNILRPFVPEHQFNGILGVLSGESGLEAARSEAAHLARLAQWISQTAITYPGGRIANGGHPLPDDAAVQGTAATCVLAYQNPQGTRKTYLTGMDDLGNLYGVRVRINVIAGPVNLAGLLKQGDILNLTMRPTPVAELLKEDGYHPEAVIHEPAVTAMHEPYRDAIARTISGERVQFVLNLAVAAMLDDWTGNARKIRMVERALRNAIPDETLRMTTLENLKTAAAAVETNRHAEAVLAGLADNLDVTGAPVQADTSVTPVEKSNASKPWLVGLTGAPGAGKDTVADMLVARSGNAIKLGFGDILYQEVSGAYGVPVIWLENRKMKDSPQSALSRAMCQNEEMQEVLKNRDYTAPLSPRYVLQQWGDYRRAQNPDYLIDHVREQVQSALDSGTSVAVSGIRTIPELTAIQAWGGVTLRVRNPEIEQALARAQAAGSVEANHPLENTLNDVPVDLEVVNDGTLEDLQAKIPGLYAQIQEPSTATPEATLQESIITALQGVPGLTIEPSPHATEVLVRDSRSGNDYSITQRKDDFSIRVGNVEKENHEGHPITLDADMNFERGVYEDHFATLDDAMDFVRHEIFTSQEAHIDESSPYYQALLNTLPDMPETERKKMFLAVTGVMPDDWTGTLMKRRVVSRVANAYAAHFPASVTIDRVMESLLAASTRINSLDLANAPLSPAAILPDAALPDTELPSAGLLAARPFVTLDPIAGAMLAKIEASPYTLSYLLGDDRARDVDDPPYEEDAEWAAARVQFADEIDAVLNARIRANVDALGERGWGQQVIHGDLTRGGAVIHLEPKLNADGDMQGLAYQVSLAVDTEGRETRTVRDFLHGSSAQFANELHGIAEQIKQNLEQTTSEHPESAQKTLDDYVIAHILEHAPMVAEQAKANALEHFLMGNVLGATSNAILDAIEDKTLPQAIRDAAKAVLQGREGMTDYRERIGRMVFEAVRAQPAVMEGERLPAEERKPEHLQNTGNSIASRIEEREQRERQIAINQEVWSVAIIPLIRPVPVDAWLPMTDAQLGFHYRTENGVCELVFGTSSGDEVILTLEQDRVLFSDPIRNLQDPVMQRVILPLLADQLPDWETALRDAGVPLRGIALPSDEDIAQRLSAWKDHLQGQEKASPPPDQGDKDAPENDRAQPLRITLDKGAEPGWTDMPALDVQGLHEGYRLQSDSLGMQTRVTVLRQTSSGSMPIVRVMMDDPRHLTYLGDFETEGDKRFLMAMLTLFTTNPDDALRAAGVELREVTLPDAHALTDYMEAWYMARQRAGQVEAALEQYHRAHAPAAEASARMESSDPIHPVTVLENIGDSVSGVVTGFQQEGKQLLLKQEDGTTIAVEHPAIDDWRMVGLFNHQGLDAREGDEERAIRALMSMQTPIGLQLSINDGLARGPIPVLNFLENGRFQNRVFVDRLKSLQLDWKAADAAYSGLAEYYGNDGFAVVTKEARQPSISANNANVSIRYVNPNDSTASTEVSLHFASGKDQIRAVLKNADGMYLWGHSQDLENRGDLQWLIGALELLRSESLKQQEVLKKQEPLVQAYFESYVQAAKQIRAAIDAVDKTQVTDEESARTIYKRVVQSEREGQDIISRAADALRKVSENGQISQSVNNRLGNHEPARQHREALMAVRNLETELMQIVKDHLMQKGRDFLDAADENTPIEEIAIAIFNKHGHNATRTPDMVSYVQDRDLRKIQSSIGHNSMNPASQEIFERMTGVQLGKTQKVRVRQIDAWAAVSPEMRERMDAEEKNQREERQNIKELQAAWESFAGIRMQRGGNGQDYVLAMVKDGHTQVSSYKKGASVQYGLLNPETHGVVYMTRSPEFTRFCKTVLKMDMDGVVMNALQKAGLMNATQPVVSVSEPEPATVQDQEIERLFSGEWPVPTPKTEPENAEAAVLPDLAPTMGSDLQSADLQPADLQPAGLQSADLPEQTAADLLSDPEKEDISEDEDDQEDTDLAPVDAAEKPELPGWKVGQPDMLSPLWDLQIPFTWPNENGVLPAGYTAEWIFGKGYFDKIALEIARDPQGRYHFSTKGAGSSYAPSVDEPSFATFLEAHTAAREELAEKLRSRYGESLVERSFVRAAPKLLEGVTQRADGDRHSIAKADDLLRNPPYQEAFAEIMTRLEGNQQLILTWGYRNDRNFNGWMVMLHQDENEMGMVAELRHYGDWDFTRGPEYAEAIDVEDPDAWANFIRKIAERFPESDRHALINAPYGLRHEPIWQISEPFPSERVSDLPPSPHWPEDMSDELPVEAPGNLKNFDRFVGLRFESEAENQKQYVALLIARDKQGFVPAISHRSKGISGPSVPNARDTHYPTFVQAYEQGRKMLGKHFKEYEGSNWITDADRAAKDWLNKKPGAAEPIFFGYDAARMETLWDRQDHLHDAIAVQITHRKSSSSIVADEVDRYHLQAVIAGASDTRYLSSVSSLESAMLLVNSSYAFMQNQALQALDSKLEPPEALHRAETVISHLKAEFEDLLTVAPEAKSPLRQQVEHLVEQAEQLAENIRRKEQSAGTSPTLGEIMANKLSSLATAQRLEEMFGSDEAFGITVVDERGREIVATDGQPVDGQSVFPDGSSAINCTNYAEQIKDKLEGHEVQIVGFANEDNPDCAVAREEWHPGGHDFAIVDHRWLVDPWSRLVASERDQIVYDLRDLEDARLIAETYGDPLTWKRSGTYSIGHASSLDQWDRSGLESVIEAMEAHERKAAGITITEAAIIPTRSGVVAVPTDPNLPIYHAGETAVQKDAPAPDETPKSQEAPGVQTASPEKEGITPQKAADWLAKTPPEFHDAVHSVIDPFLSASARLKYDAVDFSPERNGHHFVNAYLTGPESWQDGEITVHAQIDHERHAVTEQDWSLSWQRRAMPDHALYALFVQLQEQGLLATLRSVDRIENDYGHVIVSSILGKNEIAEIMARQGLRPLRLLLTVEPDGMPGATLERLTGHLVDRLRGLRTDFQNTPVVIDIMTMQGFPETVMDQLRTVAESVRRADTTDPESYVRRADLTAQIGAPCDWVASTLGHNFRSQQKRDLVKPLLVYQPDLIEVKLEKMLPDVLHALYQRNEANHRQMDLQGLAPLAGVQPLAGMQPTAGVQPPAGAQPLSRTQDALALQGATAAQVPPRVVEASAQPEDPPHIQSSLLDDAPEPTNPIVTQATGLQPAGLQPAVAQASELPVVQSANVEQTPPAGQDADWQRLKDWRVTLPEIMDASENLQPLLDRLVKRGIPLGLLQEPSSVNYVAAVLESGKLAGVGAQAWAVRRSDLVAQDAELRELRFYNGDPEQRHVFLLVGNRFLFDPWMAMSKPGVPYALDIQNPADRDALIDRYLSPAFWISPHPAMVLSPAWEELERWNPDLQAFADANDDEAEIPVELRETMPVPAETILPLPETMTALPETMATKSETMATEPEKVPDAPVPTQAAAGPGNPMAASPDPAAGDPSAGSSPANGSPVWDSPAVRETAAPKGQEVFMGWKSLSQTPEILPELAAYLQGLAERPERLPETGRFWAQSVPQEVLREMLVSLSAEWDREYWKMTVDFLVQSLNGNPFESKADLRQHGPAKDAITGLSFLLMHLSASESHWPGQESSILDRDAFLKSLESLSAASLPATNLPQAPAGGVPAGAQAQGAPQAAASTPAQVRGEIGPDDRIVEIQVIPLDAAEQDWNIQDGAKQNWKVQGGQEPARWKLVAILQDGWEIPKVLKAGVTYAQALQAARDRVEKWGARLVDVYADARAGIVQNKPADDLHLERGEFTDTPALTAPAAWTGTPAESVPAVNIPASGASWPASVPPSSWSGPQTAATPSGTSPSPDTGLPLAGQTPPAGQAPAASPWPAAGLPASNLPAVSPVEAGEKPGFDIPQSIWKQEVTHPMNAEEQRVMEQINAFLKDPKSITEITKRQWIGQAIVVRNKTMEMMQPYFRRDPMLAEQWQQKDFLTEMVRKTMTVNRENIPEIVQDPVNGAKRMLLQHLPVEPTLDAIRGWVLENAMTQMVMQTMNMDPFNSMMQVIRDHDYKFPHHALVDLSPPLVLFGPDRSARVILMRTPRSIPHMDAREAIIQIHACKSWVGSIMKDKFEHDRLPIQMHIAYFDASRQNVLIRDVTEIPGQADAARKQADLVVDMLEKQQMPKELPRVVSKVALTPEITRDVQEIARLEAMRQTLDTQIQKMEQDLQSRMGSDPEGWPKISQDISMGSIRTEWSSRILEDKALNALSTLGIPRSQVEKPEYDLDGMLRALNAAGIASGQFVTGHQMDTDRLNAILQAYGVPRPIYQPARPVVSPNEKHPAYQQAAQTLQNTSTNNPVPTEEFTP